MQINTLREAREFYRSHKPMQLVNSTEGIVALSPESLARSHTLFVGHGHSDVYHRVVRFLEKELKLDVLFFDDEPRGGYHNLEVIQDFLERAGFAVIVATGDDPAPRGETQARLNVNHEIGLFQGKLGFRKVAVMRQDNVRELSNLAGYQELRFKGQDVNSKFEELRGMIQRAGIKPTGPAAGT